LGKEIMEQLCGCLELLGIGLGADFEHGIWEQLLPFHARLRGRLKQILQNLLGRQVLGQQQLDRIRWPQPRRPQGWLSQPLGEGRVRRRLRPLAVPRELVW